MAIAVIISIHHTLLCNHLFYFGKLAATSYRLLNGEAIQNGAIRICDT